MTRTRSARGQGDELREELLDAAETLLAELEDERRVTIRAIVERVGVTPPSLYLHFPDKAALIQAVVERRFAALAEATQAVAGPLEAAGDPAAALRAGCRAYLDWARDNPGSYRVLFEVQRDTELQREDGTTGSEAFDQLARRIATCQHAGMADVEAAAADIAAVVWAGLHGLATLTVLRKRFPWPPIDQMLDLLLTGVAGLPPTGATDTSPTDATDRPPDGAADTSPTDATYRPPDGPADTARPVT